MAQKLPSDGKWTWRTIAIVEVIVVATDPNWDE